MASNQFFRVDGLDAAHDILSSHQKVRILAGGTDLMIDFNLRVHENETVLYIGDCGLDTIKVDGDVLRIGATVKHADILKSDLVREHAPLLVEAVKQIGSSAIRNAGTIGGNIVNASPASDGSTALLALGAKLRLSTPSGTKEVDLEKFFVGPKKTIIADNEILESISVPLHMWTNSKWEKVGRRSSDTIAIFSVAIAANIAGDICKNARIALGSVAPTPFLAVKSSEMLRNRKLDEAVIEEVASSIYDEISPIDDVRATAWYRRAASRNVVRNLLKQMASV